MQKAVAMMFPTPVGEFVVENCDSINEQLRALVLEKERTQPSQSYANAGGWHSRTDLLEWKNPAIEQLQKWIIEAIEHMIAQTYEYMQSMGMPPQGPPGRLHARAWANVSRNGHYHRMHNHPGYAWSGAYYVSCGKDAPGRPLSGLFELPDPRPHANMVPTPGNPFGQKILIKPVPGKIVIFPSWMEHFVHPFYGDGERISIAFNVRLAEQID